MLQMSIAGFVVNSLPIYEAMVLRIVIKIFFFFKPMHEREFYFFILIFYH
jgi:hypothetical protein